MDRPMDYNQHLLAYMQAWRQLLEASAAITSGMAFPAGHIGHASHAPHATHATHATACPCRRCHLAQVAVR